MEAGSQINAEIGLRMAQKQLYSSVLPVVSRQRTVSAAIVLVQVADRFFEERDNVSEYQKRLARIFLTNFHFNFSRFIIRVSST